MLHKQGFQALTPVGGGEATTLLTHHRVPPAAHHCASGAGAEARVWHRLISLCLGTSRAPAAKPR